MIRIIFLLTFVLSASTYASTEKLLFEGEIGNYEAHCLNGSGYGSEKQDLKAGYWKIYRITTNQVLGYEIYQKLKDDSYTFIASCKSVTRRDL
tara:strand:- start:466 stop:744 length:279 start_codon:yes stop_codon:yes gene_type:complete